MSNTVSVIIPPRLRKKAKQLGINISEVARVALADEVKKAKEFNKTGESLASTLPPAASPEGEAT